MFFSREVAILRSQLVTPWCIAKKSKRTPTTTTNTSQNNGYMTKQGNRNELSTCFHVNAQKSMPTINEFSKFLSHVEETNESNTCYLVQLFVRNKISSVYPNGKLQRRITSESFMPGLHFLLGVQSRPMDRTKIGTPQHMLKWCWNCLKICHT